MLELFSALFDTSGFPPRWHCGNWSATLGWTHIAADAAIFGAYAAIPTAIAIYASKRRSEVAFPKLYWLFALFIFSCGFGHLVEATMFWRPWYRFSGSVKVVTALASWATVIALYRYLPLATTLPGAVKLNAELRREVEERRRAEDEVRRLNAALAQRVQELETLLDVLPVGIGIAVDPECRDIRMNRAFAKMLALPENANSSLSAEAPPSSFRVLKDGRELAPEELPMQHAVRQGVIVRDFEEEIAFDGKSSIQVLGYAAPLYDEQHNVRGAVGAFIDITSRKRAEDERQHVERKLLDTQKLESLGVLAGGIAHDFNNLLTGILGNACLARMELAPDSRMHHHLEQVEKASMRASELCKQMLAYSGRGRFIVERIDLNRVVEETADLLRLSIAKTSILKFDVANVATPVLVDATQIRQVLMNLVINASEALGERSGVVRLATGLLRIDASEMQTLTLAAEMREGDYAFIEVSDTGAGMSKETMAKIFDPFFTTKFTGRGLGLAAVLGIVRGHHGGIRVRSEPWKGTTFSVFLPCAEGRAPEAPVAYGAADGWRAHGRALVIDDEDTSRTVAARMLEKMGFEVDTEGDGETALERFSRDPSLYAIVVLDLTMPRLDGVQTFEALRALRPDVRVLLMSGFNEQDATTRFAGRGLADFIQKPFRPDLLLSKVRRIVEGDEVNVRRGDPSPS
jgi:two-component system, cell cycle sensor histidine kinase and response regulator CckA